MERERYIVLYNTKVILETKVTNASIAYSSFLFAAKLSNSSRSHMRFSIHSLIPPRPSGGGLTFNLRLSSFSIHLPHQLNTVTLFSTRMQALQ